MSKSIKLIIGSTRTNRAADAISEWVVKQAKKSNVEIETVDLKALNLPPFDAATSPAMKPVEGEAVEKWREIVTGADSLLFLTAEYNRGMPSSLKSAIDYLSPEWEGKKAGIISYGFIDGGKSAAAHLVDVLNWLKLDLIEMQANIQLTQSDFTDTGAFADIDASFAPHEDTLKGILESLNKN